jgi:streptogramin lyase
LAPIFFERMEPKILYSADALSGLVSVDPFGDSDTANASLNVTQSARFLEESFAPGYRDPDGLFDTLLTQPLALDNLQAAFDGVDAENSFSAEFETLETFSEGVSNPIESRQEIIFIDAATPDYGSLLEGKTDDPNTQYRIVILQSDRDGIEQISSTLGALQGIDAIHLVSHGNQHGLQLGDAWISNDNLDSYSEQLRLWATALDQNADLLIYGCELASGADGQLLIKNLAELTTADVAASDDLTGAAALGGDWELEHRFGQIDTPVAFDSELQQKYSNVLADFTVNVTTDSVDINPGDGIAIDATGNTSLRAAIMEANALVGDDSITLPSGNYRLTLGGLGEDLAASGDLDILDRLMITGADASTSIIDADGIDRVFQLLAGASLGLSDVTITGGAAGTGAGINNAGALLLVDSALTQNTATGEGGGLHTVFGSTTTIERVEISLNQAVQGAGIYADSSNSSITNSTISTNNASKHGGGIYISGGAVTVTNSTIVGNVGTNNGSGIKTVAGGTVTLQNTLLENTGDNLTGAVVSLGYNIDTNATSELTEPSDQTNVTVNLGALLDNGGATRTHALLPGGTATPIDPAGLTGAPTVDQRGLLRDGTADIGAFEFSNNNAPIFLSSGPYNVDEGAVTTSVVGDVDADDGDGGAADVGIAYSITSNVNPDADGDNAFTIDPSSGEITVNDAGDLDFESTESLVISVQADDGVLTSTRSVTVNLKDVAPTLTAAGAANINAGETYVLDLIASEPGTSGITSYTVNWGDGNITTEPYTGPTTSVSHVYGSFGFTYSITFAANDVSDTWTASNLLATNWVQNTDDIYIIDGNGGNTVGAFESSGGVLSQPYGIVVGPDGNYYVAGYDSDNIVRYSADGSYLGIFSAHAHIDKPTGLAWGNDGNLYVGNYGGDNILRFNASGDFIDIWGDGGALDAPEAIVFGPDGNLYVSDSRDRQVVMIDGGLGGSATTVYNFFFYSPEQLAFGPDGALYMAGTTGDSVFRWEAGNIFATTHFSHTDLDNVSGLAFGPDGQLYVSSDNNDIILRYDGVTGEVFSNDGAGGIDRPKDLVFTPDHQVTIVNNSPPTATNLSTTNTYIEDDASVAINNIVVSDVDAGETISATLTLANALIGSLSANDGATYNSGSGLWTISDSVANVNIALANLIFIPAGNNDLDTVISVEIDDSNEDVGGALTGVITLDVTPANDPPVLAAIGNQSIDELDTLSLTVTANDIDLPGDSLTYSIDAASLALGMSISSTSGEFSWTPTEGQGGLTASVTIAVTDDGTGNLIDSEVITITVNDINVAPVLSAIGNQSIDELTTLNFTASATDSDLPSDTLSYALDAGSITLGMSINSTSGEFSWTPTEGQGGLTASVTIAVTDDGTGNLIDNDTFTITVNEVNVAPVVTNLNSMSTYGEGAESVAITDIVVNDGDTAEIINAMLTLANTATGSLSANDGATYASGSGLWTISDSVANVNIALANLTFIPNGNNDLDTVISVEIDDVDEDISGALTGVIALEVIPVNDAPVLSSIGNQTIDERIMISFTANANDIDQPADTLNYSLDADSIALGMSIDPSSGEFSWTPTEEHGGLTYSLIITVSDDGTGNLIDSQVITIMVNDINDAPDLAAASSQSIDERPLPIITIDDSDLPADNNSNTLQAESAVAEPVVADPLIDVEAPISMVFVEVPASGLPLEITPEFEAPSVRDYDYSSSNIRDATMVKPSGLAILITKLNEQLNFFDDPFRLINEESFSAKLNDMREEITTDTKGSEKIVGSSLSVTAGLSGGYVIWLVRSGVLLSSALSSLPTWRFIDPLPVLSGSRSDSRGESDDSLESMVADKGVEENAKKEAENENNSKRHIK